MIDAPTWEGVQSLLDNYVGVRDDDIVLVLFTSDSYESAAWVSAALDLRNISVTRVWMAPLQDDGLLERLTAALPTPESFGGRLVVLSFERDTMSHEQTLALALSRFDRRRCDVYRSISAGAELFAGPLRVSPQKLSSLNAAILERCVGAGRMRIVTAAGTDLEVEIDSARHRWISNRGTARPGGVVVLPAGEVATFPASISGVFVADCAFNVNLFTTLDARLDRHPVSVWIEKGRAVRYECNNTETLRFLDTCFSRTNAHNVGELGFGTNVGSTVSVPMNSHINERRPGVHLGFGQHNQSLDVVGFRCTIHIDLIAKGGKLWLDDDMPPLDLEAVVPSQHPHPVNLRDEDVFSPKAGDFEASDCCSIPRGGSHATDF